GAEGVGNHSVEHAVAAPSIVPMVASDCTSESTYSILCAVNHIICSTKGCMFYEHENYAGE
ncbi:MAG: hypothetical protein KDE58_42940, partial [Caldilineaceae bacterium]|nr:hypothetical protein [Caldilineaceae bacterium]